MLHIIDTKITKMKINIIGDSFTMAPNPNDNVDNKPLIDIYWVQALKEKYPNATFFVDGDQSRDVQTMLDHWIKQIPKLNPEDFLIVCLPYLGRTRLPRVNYMGMYDEANNHYYETRFIGTMGYANRPDLLLEHWGHDIEREEIYKMMEPQQIVNSSIAFCKNLVEVVTSLKQITPCKTYVFCWDYINVENDVIEDRNHITKQIGYWETFHDQHKQSNGAKGMLGNLHWSFPYNKDFGKYVLTKFV